jgi:endonuclease/exonuclease/phosphatase family metal-dependent hydrolase
VQQLTREAIIESFSRRQRKYVQPPNLEAVDWAALDYLGWAHISVHMAYVVMRCDYILASRTLAACAVSYGIARTPATDMASDHYPVITTFEVPL